MFYASYFSCLKQLINGLVIKKITQISRMLSKLLEVLQRTLSQVRKLISEVNKKQISF